MKTLLYPPSTQAQAPTAGSPVLASLLVAALLASGCRVESTTPAEAPPVPDRPPAAAEAGSTAPSLDTIELTGGEASLARNFYFVFDGSGSMRSEPEPPCVEDGRFRSKLEGAEWAVREFLAKVPDDVHLGLYVFDRRGRREVLPLGAGNRDAFLAAVRDVEAGGSTPLAKAIEVGTDRLVEQYRRQLGYGEYRLVVVTDGQAEQIPVAANYAAQWGMPIYAIGLCIGEDHPLRQFAVSYRAADSFDDLARGLEETLAELPSFDATSFDAGAAAGADAGADASDLGGH